ncbi:MAG: lipocalin family protein [Spirochaetia bacterium]|jgi:hypothetical protein|nr:lipocalin family protein [Spirochaetia bacterium]
MKKTVLILLALCLVVFMIGCDGSGGSDSSEIGKSSGAKFTVTDLTSHMGISNFKVVKGKGIEFKEGGMQCKIYKTITFDSATLDKSGKFTATVDVLFGGETKYSDSGTWSRSGSTITIKSTSKGGTETVTISADGKTLTDSTEEPNIHAMLIYTKQ